MRLINTSGINMRMRYEKYVLLPNSNTVIARRGANLGEKEVLKYKDLTPEERAVLMRPRMIADYCGNQFAHYEDGTIRTPKGEYLGEQIYFGYGWTITYKDGKYYTSKDSDNPYIREEISVASVAQVATHWGYLHNITRSGHYDGWYEIIQEFAKNPQILAVFQFLAQLNASVRIDLIEEITPREENFLYSSEGEEEPCEEEPCKEELCEKEPRRRRVSRRSNE